MMRNQKVGRWGEETAAPFPRQRGYEILAHNACSPHDDIDNISRKSFFLKPNVTDRKHGHMLAGTESCAPGHAVGYGQIDVIATQGKQGLETKITHFGNAITQKIINDFE
jgi:Holliday junction resolvase-like predicted endonuclease